MAEKQDEIYQGKAKKVFSTNDLGLCIVSYKDDMTAFNGVKKANYPGKGALNNRISNHLMAKLAENGIPTHFVKELNDRETLVLKLEIIPLEVCVRISAAGSLVGKLGLNAGETLPFEVVELYYKNDALGDPMLNDEHVLALGIASLEEVVEIRRKARQISTLLQSFFGSAGIRLVDFKLEFGRNERGDIILADEISPDTCRLWDLDTGEVLDKDRFRQDMGGVVEAYAQVFERMGI